VLADQEMKISEPDQVRERKRRISEAWFENIRKFPTSSRNPVIQHRLVFSMSGELHDKLVETGINPDCVLQSTTKNIMGKFNERFHPADSICLRLRDSPRHGQPSCPCRDLPANRRRRVAEASQVATST
jgi:hypothetical protein